MQPSCGLLNVSSWTFSSNHTISHLSHPVTSGHISTLFQMKNYDTVGCHESVLACVCVTLFCQFLNER